MVKFKVKCGAVSTVVNLQNNDSPDHNNDLTLLDLKICVQYCDSLTHLLTGKNFEVSLNGNDLILGNERTLTELGLVQGDILRIVITDSAASEPEGASGTVNSSGSSKCDIVKSDQTSKAVERDVENIKTNQDKVATSSSSTESSTPGPSQPESTSAEQMSSSSTESSTPGPSQPESTSAEQRSSDNHEEDSIHDEETKSYLTEPMLIRESTSACVPQSLSLTFRGAEVTNAHEALFLVMHVLMLETGFSCHYDKYRMPDKWRKPGGVFSIQYSCERQPGNVITLTYISLGTAANVICTVDDSKFQEKLNCPDYVPNVNPEANRTYINLPKLSCVFKDKISFPALQSLDLEGAVSSLANLGAEVQLLILRHLGARDLLHLSRVNKYFLGLSKDKLLWRRLFMKDFGRRAGNNEVLQDWYALYKGKYIERKERLENMERMRRQLYPPPFHNPYADPQPFHPSANYPPGFVGGDYDLNPFHGGFPGGFGTSPGHPLAMPPRPRYDPIGPYPGAQDARRPPLRGWGPRSGGRHPGRDPFGFSGGFI